MKQQNKLTWKQKARLIAVALVLGYILYCIGYVVSENGTPQTPVAAKTTPITSMSVYEAVNEQRVKAGQPPLDYSQTLQKSAEAKCNDMVTKNYWSHVTPEGKQPQDFVKQLGYDYLKFGENLAFDYHSTPELVSGWMNSPTHKENIVAGEYKTSGIAVCEGINFQGHPKTTIVVQHFALPSK